MEVKGLTVLIEARNMLAAQLEVAQAQVQGFTAKAGGFIKKHKAAFAAAGAAIGAVAFKTAKDCINAASEFEKGLSNVKTLLDKTAQHWMPAYKKGIEDLSVAFGESTETLTKGLYDIISAATDPAKALDVLEVSAKAAIAGLSSTGVAADAVTTVLNAYGLSADHASEVSDKLFVVVNRGKVTFEELASNIGKVAGLAAQADLSFDELGAAIATLTRAGLRIEEAGTAIRGILNIFLKGGPEAAEIARTFGIELSTSTLKGDGLVKVLYKLKDASMEQLATLSPNIRGLVGLAGGLGDLEGITKDLNMIQNSLNATEDAFAMHLDDASLASAQLHQTLGLLKVRIGEELLPYVKEFTKWLQEGLAGGFTSVINGVKRVIAAFKLIGHTIEGVWEIFRGFIQIVAVELEGVGNVLADIFVPSRWKNIKSDAQKLSTDLSSTFKKNLDDFLETSGKIEQDLEELVFAGNLEIQEVVKVTGQVLTEEGDKQVENAKNTKDNLVSIVNEGKDAVITAGEDTAEELIDQYNEANRQIADLTLDLESQILQNTHEASNARIEAVRNEMETRLKIYREAMKDAGKTEADYEEYRLKIEKETQKEIDAIRWTQVATGIEIAKSLADARLMLGFKSAKAEKQWAIAVAGMEQAIAIARLWATAMKEGPVLGPIIAAANTGLLLAQFETQRRQIVSQNITPMAEGGIIRKPTLVMAGERGPEAFIPLREMSPITVNVNVEGNTITSETDISGLVDEIADKVKEGTIEGIKLSKSIFFNEGRVRGLA